MIVTVGSGLLELAERCEAATRPDRELDWDIADAMGSNGSIHKRVAAPRYTASLDAAMTLVPEHGAVERSGWHTIGTPWAGFEIWMYREENGTWLHSSSDPITEGNAATPALALCAAALRARASQATP